MRVLPIFLQLIIILSFTSISMYSQNSESLDPIKHANQLLNELIPDNNLIINESGIFDKEIDAPLINFPLIRELGLDGIIIDESQQTFALCCTPVMTFDEDGNATESYSAIVYPYIPTQLFAVIDLKKLLEKIISNSSN